MLVFWTSAEDATYLKVVKNALSSIGKGIAFRKETFDGKLYTPKKGEFVLAMGLPALEVMQAEGLIPKNRKVNKSRGAVINAETGGCWMISFDPGICQRDATKDPIVRWDIRLLERYARTGSLQPEVGEYEWVDDLSEVIQYVKDKFDATGKAVDVALDLETMGLVPYISEKEIVTLQTSVEEEQAQVIYILGSSKKEIAALKKQIKWLLNTPKVSLKGANLKYDLIWIRVKYNITCTNFKFDTLLVGSLLNENRSNSLKVHAYEYTPLGGYDAGLDAKYDKAHMELIPQDDPDFLTYAGGDTDACLRTSNQMRKDLKNNKGLQHFYIKILHPVSRVFEEIEYHGVYIDEKQFERVRKKVQTDVDRCTKRLTDILPRRLKLKHRDKKSLLSPAILREFLFTPAGLNLKPKLTTPKTGLASTKYDHLMMFLDNPDASEFIRTLKQLSGSAKTVSTFIDGFLKHLRPDGKLHPTYALFSGDLYGQGNEKDDAGTDTGRFSTRDPAIHILPKHTRWAKDLRSCYTAPPGHVIFSMDFSEGELRIAACISDDQEMIAAYKKGISLHDKTAASMSGATIEELLVMKEKETSKYDNTRRKAKAVNFGFIYGMQAPTLQEYARTTFGLELTMAECKAYRDTFFNTYPRIIPWHEYYKNMARQHKQVVSPLGRIRHLPLIDSPNWGVKSLQERRAINAPVQGCLSDICARGIVAIRERFTMQEVWLAGMTHDSVYGYIPEDHVMERLKEMKQILENLPLEKEFGWKPQIGFPVDADISTTNMAELKAIQL